MRTSLGQRLDRNISEAEMTTVILCQTHTFCQTDIFSRTDIFVSRKVTFMCKLVYALLECVLYSKMYWITKMGGDTYYPTIRHPTADRWYSRVICTSDRFLVDKDQVHITRQNLNKIWRLASQSATSNWLEISSKAKIPIEDIPAGWKTNQDKASEIYY